MVSGVKCFRFSPVFAMSSTPVCVNEVVWNMFRLLGRVIVLTIPKPTDDIVCLVSDLYKVYNRSTTYYSECLMSGLRSEVSSVCGCSYVTTLLRLSLSLLCSSGWFGAFVMRSVLNTFLTRSCRILTVSGPTLITRYGPYRRVISLVYFVRGKTFRW